MEKNVPKLPAGLLPGDMAVEFYNTPDSDGCDFIHNGKRHTWQELPIWLYNILFDDLVDHPDKLTALIKGGITDQQEQVKIWTMFQYGNFDFVPDITSDMKLNPEYSDITAFNDFLAKKLSNPFPITKQEIQIVKLICEGLSDAEISGRLFISEHTVHAHRANIEHKLNLSSKPAIVAWAHKNNLV